jgi:hypothetical protein
MSDAITGACLCGAVAYAAEGPFPVFQYCHCSRCRRFTGSAHAANVWLNQTGTMLIVPAGTIEGDIPTRPTANIMCASRAPWYVPTSELETHEALPPRKG